MRQEVEGGYLWSPVREANGARSQFYDNLRRAAPGDLVLSYAAGQVGRIGKVSDYAISAPKPEEFGTIGLYWSATGWLLPVQWLDADIAVRPKDLIKHLAPLLPAKHSPIQPKNGNGNQKAYLAEVDRGVVDLILAAAQMPVAQMQVASTETAADFATTIDDLVERNIRRDMSLNDTVREHLVRARRGQGLFRRRVLDIEPVCRITGLVTPNLLIASHIKPWRACETATERLDGANGLMLAPHADFLFDRGLLSFESDGRVIVSSQLSDADADKLGIHIVQRPPPRPLHNDSRGYLNHHRMNVFIP